MKSIVDFSDISVALAVSGGVDSMYLMHHAAAAGLSATVLHVNHGLRPSAAAEARFVAESAAALGLPCEILEWTGDKPAAGLEAAAREARYRLLTDWCHKHGAKVLMTAHQADDQIETFLMNLGRGSGVYGLSGMRPESERDGIKIVRPMLSISRAEIESYCAENKIKFVSDEMNEDENFTRVKIRKNRHLLRDKLGIPDERILLAVENLARVRDAMESQISNLKSQICANGASKHAIFTESFLFDLSSEIRLKLLSELVRKIGGTEHPLRLEKIIAAEKKLAGGDCKLTVGGCGIRRLGQKIMIAPEGESMSFRKLK